MHITNKISHYFEKFASKEFSPTVQSFINNSYVKLLGLDMTDFDEPKNYKTLNQLFTRMLLVPRQFDKNHNTFISVADSYVSSQGDINEGIALQIKGMEYSIDKLLTNHIDSLNIGKLQNGKFMNFYLSPKDYHRYHSPIGAKVTKLIHIPGKLYPVNFTYLNKQDELFIENERVVLECNASDGKLFYMVFVGALNVGKMVFDFEPRVETNKNLKKISVYEYSEQYIAKGECLGHFKMGSTVLLFWENDMVELTNLLDTSVRFGEVIATLNA